MTTSVRSIAGATWIALLARSAAPHRTIDQRGGNLGRGGDLFARESRPRIALACGIADHRRELADKQDGLVAAILELPHLPEEHRVSDVEVGTRRVEAGLHAQRLAALA